MARAPILPVRLDAEAKSRWEAAARDAGLSLSEFVRQTVEAAVGAPAAAAGRKPRGKAARAAAVVAACPRAHFHRPGTWCKACGVTPA